LLGNGIGKKIHKLIPVALLAVLVLLCVGSMRSTSPTSDEQNHISRGYHYLVTGNLDLNVAPPFVNALSAVPLLWHKGIIVPRYDILYQKTYINTFAEQFVWVYNDAETVINTGRLAIVLLSVLLGYFVLRWASELWGTLAGCLALFLYVLDPNILAHSQLVTTDLGLACFVFIATYFLWRFLRQRRNLDLVLSGVFLGLSLASKLSALLLPPIFAAVVFIEAFVIRDLRLLGAWPGQESIDKGQWRSRLYFFCAVLFVVACFAFLAMWASYRFEITRLSSPGSSHVTVNRFISNPALRQLAYRVTENLPLPFPTYFRGVRWLNRYAQRGAPAFLMGHYSTKGWWYYFLIAFAIKTPLPTLILLAAAILLGLWARVRDRRRFLPDGEGSPGSARTGALACAPQTGGKQHALYVPVVAFFGATLLSFLNIGYRHILPVLPFAFVICSSVLACALRTVHCRWARLVLVVLCLWYVWGSLSIYPHYLAYFNELAGGPDNGYRFLVDSNLDWGQDLKNLKAYMDQHGLARIHLAYFGSAHPDYYGIHALPLPGEKPDDLASRLPAVYAISATYLQGGYLGDSHAFSWLRQYEPFGKIGYSIFLYRLP